ncbi:MAG: hypothetical protein JW809_08465 [Pirellulales bacterium]|nr:hypothetical protein [Pirellulales bacterium]
MLEGDHGGPGAVLELVKRLRCEIKLPRSMADYFQDVDAVGAIVEDKRRFARRTLHSLGALEHRPTFAALPRTVEWHKIYTKDVSRGGLAFLHSCQLFPLERMRMLLPDPAFQAVLPPTCQCVVEVARCQRLAPNCFEIGATFVERLAS